MMAIEFIDHPLGWVEYISDDIQIKLEPKNGGIIIIGLVNADILEQILAKMKELQEVKK